MKPLSKLAPVVNDILAKARSNAALENISPGTEFVQGLNLEECAVLLNIEDHDLLENLYATARWIKNRIYGNRIVLFAPLYISNYCTNDCTYCGFRISNVNMERTLLTNEELIDQTTTLINMGHKRLLILTGEHPKYPINKLIEAVEVISSVREPLLNGRIDRINVEVPPMSISDYKRLKATHKIGTVTLFQETYDPDAYEKYHPSGKKADYMYRLQTMDRAMLAGIDDVGIGALLGLTDYRFEVMAMLMHSMHLDRTYGAGPHTISVPRMQPADNAPDSINLNYELSDKDFKKVIAVIRCVVPYTGMISSTRESTDMRKMMLRLGISQMSAGSHTDVKGYGKERNTKKAQFSLQDDRSLDTTIRDLLNEDYLPSFCTACYRSGRTGAKFMKLAKAGKICEFCTPNAIETLHEYLQYFATDWTIDAYDKYILRRSA